MRAVRTGPAARRPESSGWVWRCTVTGTAFSARRATARPGVREWALPVGTWAALRTVEACGPGKGRSSTACRLGEEEEEAHSLAASGQRLLSGAPPDSRRLPGQGGPASEGPLQNPSSSRPAQTPGALAALAGRAWGRMWWSGGGAPGGSQGWALCRPGSPLRPSLLRGSGGTMNWHEESGVRPKSRQAGAGAGGAVRLKRDTRVLPDPWRPTGCVPRIGSGAAISRGRLKRGAYS